MRKEAFRKRLMEHPERQNHLEIPHMLRLGETANIYFQVRGSFMLDYFNLQHFPRKPSFQIIAANHSQARDKMGFSSLDYLYYFNTFTVKESIIEVHCIPQTNNECCLDMVLAPVYSKDPIASEETMQGLMEREGAAKLRVLCPQDRAKLKTKVKSNMKREADEERRLDRKGEDTLKWCYSLMVISGTEYTGVMGIKFKMSYRIEFTNKCH